MLKSVFFIKKKQTLGGDPGGGRSSTFLDSGTSGCQSCNTRPSRFRQACDTSFDNGRRCSSGTLLSLPFNPGLYILESIIMAIYCTYIFWCAFCMSKPVILISDLRGLIAHDENCLHALFLAPSSLGCPAMPSGTLE